MKLTITLDKLESKNQSYWKAKLRSLLRNGYIALPKKCANGQIYEIEISGVDDEKVEALINKLSPTNGDDKITENDMSGVADSFGPYGKL